MRGWPELAETCPQSLHSPLSRKLQIQRVRLFIADDGVIGWDLLRRDSFRLDFANKRVVFGAISTAEQHSVPFRESSLCLAVPVDLDGHQLWMVADTGMSGAMFYQPQLEASSSASGRAVGGNVESQIALVPRLRLGTRDLDRRVHVVRPPSSALLDGIAGYLGIASLNAKEVIFDLAGSCRVAIEGWSVRRHSRTASRKATFQDLGISNLKNLPMRLRMSGKIASPARIRSTMASHLQH